MDKTSIVIIVIYIPFVYHPNRDLNR